MGRLWRDILQLDTRSIALFRVLLGSCLLLDLISRARRLEAHYTDLGMVPLQHWHATTGFRLWSAHAWLGSAEWQWGLFALSGLAALLMILGWHSRKAGLLALVLLISVQNRNVLVLHGGDVYLRLVLMWGLLLPLDARWALRPRPHPPRVGGFPAIGLMVQLSVVYVASALLKTGAPWHDGTAVYYAMNIDHYGGLLRHWLLAHPSLLPVLTKATMAMEAFGPLLLLAPSWRVRVLTVLAFWGLHVGFGLGLGLGLFPLFCIAGWSIFLPGPLWDRLGWPPSSGPRRRRIPRQLVAGVFLALIVLINGKVLGWWTLPPKLNQLNYQLRIEQKWGMFAPEPMLDDGWFQLRHGSVDLYDGELVYSARKPADIPNRYGTMRDRKLMRNLWLKKYRRHRQPYLRWACREYDVDGRLELYFVKETTPPPGGSFGDVVPVRLASIDCPKR